MNAVGVQGTAVSERLRMWLLLARAGSLELGLLEAVTSKLRDLICECCAGIIA